ncbi:MAG: glutamyl-tRNA reductase [Gammaproteobacteria bacterium]|nr:MAG: glutamyl-tRNA reductase [Gammaproteobacteria bacterium]
MTLLALGVNHHNTPSSLREKFSFAPVDVPPAMRSIRRQRLAEEVVMLSTCNRTELYLSAAEHPARLLEWLADWRGIATKTVQQHTYLHRNEAASKHLFRVATGLDSQALGEPQILGQIKAAYHTALANQGVKKTLNRLFQEAFYVAKNVRTDTKLGENAISIAYAATQLTEQFFSRYNELTALVIGAGQTGELAVKHLQKKGIGRLLIANRTLSKAQQLALSVNGYAMALSQIATHIHEADIIVSATGRGEFTVTAPMLAAGQQQRRHRMQVLLDIAVPRDIDPNIRELSNSYVFSVDDLTAIIEKNQHLRQQAARQAELLIDDYNRHFHEWLQLRQHHLLIKGVHDFAQSEKDKLTAQAHQRLVNGDDPAQVLEELATRLSKKLSHQPSLLIRRAGEQGQTTVLDAVKSVYHLD